MKKVAHKDTVFLSGREGCALSVGFLPVFWQGKWRKNAKNACKNGPKCGDHKMCLKGKL